MARCLLVLALAWSAGLARAFSLSFDETDGQKPVTKVVSLLETMSQKLEADQKADEEMKEKMDCWCKTNTNDKAASAAAAQDKLASLNTLVEELPAKIEMLSTQIRTYDVEVNKNQATKEKATAIRQQQEAHFKEDKASLTESLEAVTSALQAMNSSDATAPTTALVQTAGSMKSLAAGVEKALERQGSVALAKLSNGDRMLLDDFLKEPTRFVRGAGFLQKEEPTSSSSQIAGIMQAIADDFAEDLAKEVDEDATNQKSYEELMAAKTTEGDLLEQQVLSKTEEKAQSETLLETTKKDIKTTTGSLGEDVKFQAVVQKRCAGSDEKYQERISTRSAEMAAVSKTLQVLRADETRDLLGKTVSFLQQSTTAGGVERAAKAGSFLMTEGRKLGVHSLVTLGLQAKLDSFTKVKESIDTMVAALKKQKDDEIAHHDMCVADLAENNATAEKKEALKAKTESDIQMLKTKIAEFGANGEALEAEIAEMQKQIQLASESRKKDNVKFQEEASEQKETQEVLKKAVAFLKTFYTSSLVQIRAHSQSSDATTKDAPEDFQDYQKNSGGSDAVSLIETIIADARRLEAEAIEGEQDAQASYEEFVAATGDNIKAKTSEMEGKLMELADAKNDKAEAESSSASTAQELASLAETQASLKEECDFFVKNFEVRQKALSNELEALGQAKTLLSGAQ